MHLWSIIVGFIIAIPICIWGLIREIRRDSPFHRHAWFEIWWHGNMWTECSICHQRCAIPFGDASEIPPEVYSKFPVVED